MTKLAQQNVLAGLRANGSEADPEDLFHALLVVKYRARLANLDRDRLIRLAVRGGASQTRLGAQLGISQARVSQIAGTADIDAPDGFSGATPLEIAERYAVGELDEAQTIDELGRWPYREANRPDPYDDAWEPGPGTWTDVEFANSQGIITDDMYEAIFDRYIANNA
ncbi:hypothetical protein [Curtobacterium sp. 20TX0008]|uniref:hypothetical protein n=1 Tax=Curtobacterium sp. 20TX0008 TaxID=3022018 RepID=UPI00232E3CB0|nr:hypothetical protein [Curtobacterium sp. 20TX0008]MDB6427450.1 hypothetical protein [Curtobacterium sp. 20TX0008]